MNTQARSTDTVEYKVDASDDDRIIEQALAILSRRAKSGQLLDSPLASRNYLIMRAASDGDQMIEKFAVVFLDSQNRLIETVTMFNGTLNQTSVYPREVVRKAMLLGAASVILTHNHHSGEARPSRADESLTQTLKAALALVDVRVLDHIITTPCGKACSMAELGLV